MDCRFLAWRTDSAKLSHTFEKQSFRFPNVSMWTFVGLTSSTVKKLPSACNQTLQIKLNLPPVTEEDIWMSDETLSRTSQLCHDWGDTEDAQRCVTNIESVQLIRVNQIFQGHHEGIPVYLVVIGAFGHNSTYRTLIMTSFYTQDKIYNWKGQRIISQWHYNVQEKHSFGWYALLNFWRSTY